LSSSQSLHAPLLEPGQLSSETSGQDRHEAASHVIDINPNTHPSAPPPEYSPTNRRYG
jgi:hypothetical protein